MRILGLSAFYHDSAAALIEDGVIVAAAQEERFTRRKHDPAFPRHAIAYCLRQAEVKLIRSTLSSSTTSLGSNSSGCSKPTWVCPAGLSSFLASMPLWLREKLNLKSLLKRELAAVGNCAAKAIPPVLFTEHHQAHAASAFFPSPFERAAVLCLDGVGEWATSSLWLGEGNRLTAQWQIDFPHSLGLLYSAFTYYTGFKVNSGEYKLMGLAPYGEPRYASLIPRPSDRSEDRRYLSPQHRLFQLCDRPDHDERRFDELFGGPPRQAGSRR